VAVSTSKTICVVGTGYVGLTTGTCLADLGNRVTCVDVDPVKVLNLQNGVLPIHEPGLAEVVIRNLEAGRLSFTTSYDEGMRDAEIAFIAVGTPDDGSGGADLTQVRAAARSIAICMSRDLVIVNKSTVPIGTGDLVATILSEHRRGTFDFAVVSNPEFLREGSAVHDCMNPDRVVLGSSNREAMDVVEQLYLPLGAPVIKTDLRTAEMIKYASNAFLATRISFINEVASICDRLGADVKQVALGMGFDTRIGKHFLDAGLGFGGSCFPKDVNALIRMAHDAGQHPQMLEAVMDINRDRRAWVVERLRERLGNLEGKRIALLGIAFKPETDDIREAPSLDLIARVQADGGSVVAYDPAAMENARRETKDVLFAPDPYEAVRDADAVVLVTEWNEFKQIDLARVLDAMRGTVLIDGRNIYDPRAVATLGFDYVGVARGRPAHPSPVVEAGSGAAN
jgi:UDPglucose 6-dehydrogenase